MDNLAVRELTPRLVIGMHNDRGFSLIEILIVIVIIGITTGFALLAFGDFGAERQVKIAAEQLIHYLTLVQRQATIEDQTLGVEITAEGYKTYRLYDKKWQSLPEKGLFRFRTFPKNLNIIAKKEQPLVIIYPTGELSPFTLQFNGKKKSNPIMLIGQVNGDMLLNSKQNS